MMNRIGWLLVLFFTFAHYDAYPWGESVEDPMRLDKNVVPVSQAVNLTLDADEDSYSGSVTIELKVVDETNTFRFHAEGLDIEKVFLSGESGLTESSHKVGEKGTVTVETHTTLSPGDYTLTVHFSNEYNRQAVSLYKTENDGAGYLYTQFESEYARKAFPCWDEPGFKIPWQLTLTVPEGHEAISNTPVAKEEVKDGQKTIIFKKTPPMPVYLVALSTGRLDSLPVSGMSVPGKIYTVKGRAQMAREMGKMSGPVLKALEDYFDIPYPYKKLDQVAVPEFLWGAMENVGAITYRDSIVLLENDAVTFNQRKRLAGIIAHEMAHMWFGNLVTTKWWNDIWLNESFASWMGQKITDTVYPDFQLSIANVAYAQTAMKLDALSSTPPIRRQHLASDDPNKMFDSLSYNKGMAVLGMVEQWMGAENFRDGMREYMKTYAWGNASADDLWAILARYAEGDLTTVMGSFIDQPGVPLLSAELLSDNRLRLSQKRIINYGLEMPGANLWQIPVFLRYWDGHEINTKKLLLTEAVQTFDLASEGKILWLHPNAGEKGYYRWQVQPSVLKALASNSTEILGLRERVGFIDNLSALLKAGNLHGSAYLRNLGSLANDPSPEVLKALARAVGDLELSFVTAEMVDGYRAYVRTTLRPALDRIGLEKKEGEDEVISSLRANLLFTLGGVGNDPEVLAYVRSLSQKYMEDTDSIDSSLAGSVLAASAIHGDADLFEQFRKKFETAETPVERARYLSALGSFRNPEMVKKALQYTLMADLRPHETIAIPTTLTADPQLQPRIFGWMMDNYEAIEKRTPPRYLGWLPTLVDGRDMQLLEDARQFFSSHDRMTPLIEKKLVEVSDLVRHRASLLKKESGSIQEFLVRANDDGESHPPAEQGD